MRATQIIGLSPRALQFIQDNQQSKISNCDCPDCETKHVVVPIQEVWGDASKYGMFGDGPSLLKYLMKNGEWIHEYVQCCPWSSGPMIYLSIKDHPELDWTDEEIED